MNSRCPRNPRDPRRLLGPALLSLWLALQPAVRATPGTAYVVLQPGPAAGSFDPGAWVTDPGAWPSLHAIHPDGWSVAYRAESPPPGWERPWILRGGGPAAGPGGLSPRFACALAEMLPARTSAMIALLEAPDSAACFPGKPNPFPLYRDGWLFLPDGYIDVEGVTRGLWRGNLGPSWEAFKLDHPRDYYGDGDARRGNAGEIYFLALLHELLAQPEDVPRAFFLTLARIAVLPGSEHWQCNAILQRPGCTWALRCAWAQEQRYPIYYGPTANGEYCVTDSLPPTGGPWVEIPNHTLAILPAAGEPSLRPVEFSGLPGSEPHSAANTEGGLRLAFERTPARGAVHLRYELPEAPGRLELFDLQGRLLARAHLPAGRGTWIWQQPPAAATGLVLGRLTGAPGTVSTRTFVLP